MKKWIIAALFSLPIFSYAQQSTGKNNRDNSNENLLMSYSTYDFLPGEEIVYAEDFSQDVQGEFPLLWATNNKGEVTKVLGQKGQWLRMFHKSHFASPMLKGLPENFTAEFDMIVHFREKGYVYPNLVLKMVQSPQSDKEGNEYVSDPYRDGGFEITMLPGEEESSAISLSSQKDGQQYFNSDQKNFKRLSSYFDSSFHVALWIQKQRLRLWINGEKVYDIPKAIPPGMKFNRLAFEITDCFYQEEQVGIFVSNIRIAQGSPDIRQKLLNEGKLVTNGILFDVNSDRIKEQSYGLLKEIATALQGQEDMKFMITGFTDSDGDTEKNLELSKRRAISVKQFLVSHFNISEDRLLTRGKGEEDPLADNKTKEGRAKNRRVEFTQLKS